MTQTEKQVLNDLLNSIQNLAQSLDATQAVLIRKGLVTSAEIDAQYPLHARDVERVSAGLRAAINSLS